MRPVAQEHEFELRKVHRLRITLLDAFIFELGRCDLPIDILAQFLIAHFRSQSTRRDPTLEQVLDQIFAFELPELDVRTTTRHIRRDHHRAQVPRILDHIRFTLMLLRVEHRVLDLVLPCQHLRDHLGTIHRGRPDQDWTTSVMERLDLIDDRFPLVLLAQVHQVIMIMTRDRLIRRDRNHIKVVDIMELLRFGIRSTGHPRKLLVHLKEVLDRHRRDRLRLSLDVHPFFTLNRLVQAIRPLTTDHRTTSIRIHNHNARLTLPAHPIGNIHHDVILVPLIHRIRTQRLLQQVRDIHVLINIERPNTRKLLSVRDPLVRQVRALAIHLDLVVLRELISLMLKLREFLDRIIQPLLHLRHNS